MKLLIKNASIVTHETVFPNHWLLIEDKKIHSFERMENCPEIENFIDAEGNNLLPGAIEMHIHGADGVDAMDADMEYVEKISAHLPKTGSTSFLATTMTSTVENVERSLMNLADYTYQSGAEMLDIHQEGPFISKKTSGRPICRPYRHARCRSDQTSGRIRPFIIVQITNNILN